jgi:hypothetical protein
LKLLNDILRFFKPDKAIGPKRADEDRPVAPIKNSVNSTDEGARLLSDGNGAFDVIVVGVTRYQEAFRSIFGDTGGQAVRMVGPAEIILDDNNPFDACAVRIEIDGKLVGHLGKQRARDWRSKMIAEGLSDPTTCSAKVEWGRGFKKEGSYGVWLDIDLRLPDSKPDPSGRPPAIRSDYVEFLVNKLNRFELLTCKVGDGVNLWEATDEGEVFVYKQGNYYGEGKLGICPDASYRLISAAPGCDVTIASIYEGGCKIACRLVSEQEMAERERQMELAEEEKLKPIRDRRRKELSKTYTPKTTPITASVYLDGKHKVKVGDKLYLDIKEMEHYLRDPRYLRIGLMNNRKKEIGQTRTNPVSIEILKAHYNGYELDLKVVYVSEGYDDAVIEIVPTRTGAKGR